MGQGYWRNRTVCVIISAIGLIWAQRLGGIVRLLGKSLAGRQGQGKASETRFAGLSAFTRRSTILTPPETNVAKNIRPFPRMAHIGVGDAAHRFFAEFGASSGGLLRHSGWRSGCADSLSCKSLSFGLRTNVAENQRNRCA